MLIKLNPSFPKPRSVLISFDFKIIRLDIKKLIETSFPDAKVEFEGEDCNSKLLIISEQFAGMSSLIYHLYPPTVVSEIKRGEDVSPKIAIDKNMKALSFKGFSLSPEKDFLASRKTLFVNNDLHIGLAAPKEFSEDYFYRNSDADEMLFIHISAFDRKKTYK